VLQSKGHFQVALAMVIRLLLEQGYLILGNNDVLT
jgi:hypothetical protein